MAFNVCVIGRVGTDPTESGKSMRFRLVTDRYDWGAKERVGDWATVFAFRVPPGLAKGSIVVVRGELTVSEYNGKSDVTINADRVEYGPSTRSHADAHQQERSQAAAYGGGAPSDDIPF